MSDIKLFNIKTAPPVELTVKSVALEKSLQNLRSVTTALAISRSRSDRWTTSKGRSRCWSRATRQADGVVHVRSKTFSTARIRSTSRSRSKRSCRSPIWATSPDLSRRHSSLASVPAPS